MRLLSSRCDEASHDGATPHALVQVAARCCRREGAACRGGAAELDFFVDPPWSMLCVATTALYSSICQSQEPGRAMSAFSSSLLDVPCDAMMILCDFLAPCIAPLVALCRTTRNRLSNDQRVWRKAICTLMTEKRGRTRLWPMAPKLIRQFPELSDCLPKVLVERAMRYALAPDGKLFASTDYELVSIRACQTNMEIAAWQAESIVLDLCFSPDSTFLACTYDSRYVDFVQFL